MGWFSDAGSWISRQAGELTEAFTEAAGTVIDTTVHTMAVVVDGVEAGIGTLGGVVVGGVGDLANAAVKGVGDAAEWAGIEGAGDLQLYEGGFGTGIGAVNNAITEGIDDAQAFLIDKPVNWALDQAGIDYELQYARPPLRNDFDRVVFGVAKTGTEVVGGIALVAVTGGAAGAIGIGSATTAGLASAAVTGTGAYITAGATAYSLVTNVHDQFEQSEARREAMGVLLENGFGAPTAEPTNGEIELNEPAETVPSFNDLMDRAFEAPKPQFVPAGP